jgi:hypothetical protein
MTKEERKQETVCLIEYPAATAREMVISTEILFI